MEPSKLLALVVDDERNVLKTLTIALESLGLHVFATLKPQDVLAMLHEQKFDLAFVDLKMSPMDGMEVLDEIRKYSSQTTTIIMTAHGSIDSAVEAIKKGAHDYLQKPFDLEELTLFLDKVLEHHRLRTEVRELREELTARQAVSEIVTRSRVMMEQLDLAGRVAESALSILIEGESGTGKELLAEFVHRKSPRAEKPLIKVNCAAIPEQLLESELFGYVRGAFTGAVKDRQGRFEAADGGTIFLDEVAELSSSIQAKLLRVLQSKEYERIGENQTRKTDVRVIAATNRNLDEALKEGTFREDLFYRLNAIRLKLPPLRERPEDIPLLLQHFLKVYSAGRSLELSPGAEKILRAYRWAGNVRELEHVIERAVILTTGGIIEVEHLPTELRNAVETSDLPLSLEEIEKMHIKKVLQQAKDYDEAARLLGVDRKTLLNKRKKFDL